MADHTPLARPDLDGIRLLDAHDPRHTRVTIPRLLCEIARLRDRIDTLDGENRRLLDEAAQSPRHGGAAKRWVQDNLDPVRTLRAWGLRWKRLARIRLDEVTRANREVERLRALYEPTVYSRANPSMATLRAAWDELASFLAEHGALLREVERLRAENAQTAAFLKYSTSHDA
jgi:hypothetical protein